MRDPAKVVDAETRLVALGVFLRSRRAQLVAHEAAPGSMRRRRIAAGMPREQVAARAGITYDWYSRIELGKSAVPSVQTLQAIAAALELNTIDTRYAFELAGLPVPAMKSTSPVESIAALECVILEIRAAAAVIYDLYGSPLCWNATADGLFRWSRFSDPFNRNMIVAGLSDPYYRDYLGADFDRVARGIVGVFRRVYTTEENPPPLARRIYEFGMAQPVFRSMWNENSVASAFTPSGPIDRYVPEIGHLRIDFNDLSLLGRSEFIIRVLSPHDNETRQKFQALSELGSQHALLDPNA